MSKDSKSTLNINKHDFPLLVLEDIKPFIKRLRSQIKENGHLFMVERTEDYIIKLRSKEKWEYKFEVTRFDISQDDDVTYPFSMNPSNERGDPIYSEATDGKGLIVAIDRWVDILKVYESLSLEDEDELLLQYEQEFYQEFEFVDDPNHPIGFNPEQLDFLYAFLTTLEKDLKSTEFKDETMSIVADTLELRDNIQGMTKKQFAKQFSILLAKIKKVGMKLLYDTFDVAKKELIKKALYGGISKLGEAGEHLLNNLTSP